MTVTKKWVWPEKKEKLSAKTGINEIETHLEDRWRRMYQYMRAPMGNVENVRDEQQKEILTEFMEKEKRDHGGILKWGIFLVDHGFKRQDITWITLI